MLFRLHETSGGSGSDVGSVDVRDEAVALGYDQGRHRTNGLRLIADEVLKERARPKDGPAWRSSANGVVDLSVPLPKRGFVVPFGRPRGESDDMAYAAIDGRVENPFRNLDLVFDERRHEEEGLHSIEEARIDAIHAVIEADYLDLMREELSQIARSAGTDTNLCTLLEERSTNLAANRAARPGNEYRH
jgi:hypothetical protein